MSVMAASRSPLGAVLIGGRPGVTNRSPRPRHSSPSPPSRTPRLTLTLTGLAADSRIGAAKPSRSWRRLASVLAMLTGALVGALLVLNISVATALRSACTLQAAVAARAMVLAAGSAPAAWAPPAPAT